MVLIRESVDACHDDGHDDCDIELKHTPPLRTRCAKLHNSLRLCKGRLAKIDGSMLRCS